MIMNVKTMEGLAGANTSIRMIAVPMNVAKEAERKGDTGKMERALGYAAQMQEQADEYGEKAKEGMKLDAREAKKQEKEQQEKLIQARREERKELEKELEKKAGEKAENAAGSEIGSAQTGEAGIGESGSSVPGTSELQVGGQTDPGDQEAVKDIVYSGNGTIEAVGSEAGAHVNVSV